MNYSPGTGPRSMTLISGIGATEPLASIALDLKAAAGIPALSAAGYSLLKGILSFLVALLWSAVNIQL